MKPLFFSLSALCALHLFARTETPLSFRTDPALTPYPACEPAQPAFDDAAWVSVTPPHTPRFDAPTLGAQYYKGETWYRTTLKNNPEWRGKEVSIVFDGVMQKADIWVDGTPALTHLGGYLPFVLRLTPHLAGKAGITIAVRADNRASNLFPPGKDHVDFTYHGGIYRPARLVMPAESSVEAGIAPMIIQAATQPGAITITAKAEGLPRATLTLRSVR